MKGFFRSRLVLTLVMLVLLVGVTVVTFMPGLRQLRPERAVAASSVRVLILAGTVTGGSSSIEASEAAADGLAVDVVDAATWSAMTAAQFASYRAIILGDPTCSGITPDIDAAAANSKVWGPTINGNIVILGTDPVFHASQGGETVTRRGVDFAVNQVGKTGAYITLSCYYHGTAPNTPVPLLDGIGAGGFTVTGVGCYNNAHIVAESPALNGLTDADISNWSCSVHEAFQTWASGLIPLAIAKDFDSSFTASDGTQGPPYILAGGDIRSFPLSITPLNDSAAAGSSHTVTAQLLDGVTRNPLAGAKIGFQVTAGPNAGVTGVCSPASCVTGTDGQVSWTYTSKGSTGSDTIEAFYDINNNGTADVGEPQTTAGMQWNSQVADSDHDGIPDTLEQQLAERYAPVILFDPSEPNYPIGVDAFLTLSSHPSLKYYENCGLFAPANLTAVNGPIAQADLLGHSVISSACERSTSSWSPITSEQANPLTNYGGSKPNETFYLSNVSADQQTGSLDPAHWITYYHAYPAANHGIMIQYWHFFAYNNWLNGGRGPNVDDHGGDWDASIQVLLKPDLQSIQQIWYSRHEHDSPGDPMTNIVPLQGTTPPDKTNIGTAYLVNNTHPLVMADSGGHAAFSSPADVCYYWQHAFTFNLNTFGQQVWGDSAKPKGLAEVSCNSNGKDRLKKNQGGTVWYAQTNGQVLQDSPHTALHLTTANNGGPLRNLGEYNPGNMSGCSSCAGLSPGNASFHPGDAGVFTGYSGLWGSPNSADLTLPGYPPRGPVFQGYNDNNQFTAWYNDASNNPWPNN